jgi:hypothetical protein
MGGGVAGAGQDAAPSWTSAWRGREDHLQIRAPAPPRRVAAPAHQRLREEQARLAAIARARAREQGLAATLGLPTRASPMRRAISICDDVEA